MYWNRGQIWAESLGSFLRCGIWKIPAGKHGEGILDTRENNSPSGGGPWWKFAIARAEFGRFLISDGRISPGRCAHFHAREFGKCGIDKRNLRIQSTFEAGLRLCTRSYCSGFRQTGARGRPIGIYAVGKRFRAVRFILTSVRFNPLPKSRLPIRWRVWRITESRKSNPHAPLCALICDNAMIRQQRDKIVLRGTRLFSVNRNEIFMANARTKLTRR